MASSRVSSATRIQLVVILLLLAVFAVSPCWAQTFPITDAFTGSGALSSNWTNTAAGTGSNPGLSYPFSPLVRSGGNVVPSGGSANGLGPWGLATYTGAVFTAGQYAQVKFVAHSSAAGGTGPCVLMSVNGSGYCYEGDQGIIASFYYGVGYQTSGIGVTCPVPASGDTIRLIVQGTTITCSDLTQGTSGSGSISGGYTSGNPGMLVDQHNSTVYALTSFQADCIPTCATTSSPAATPTFSPVAGTYTTAQTVTIGSLTSGATIYYYTTNGSTPTTASTVYSRPISVAASQTVKAIAAAAGYTTSAVGSATYTINTAGSKTVSGIVIFPQGAAIQSGSSQQFSVTCNYTDGSSDNCSAAGGASWSTSALTSLSVNSSGLATWTVDPGAGNTANYFVVVSAGNLTDRAQVFGQHPGDTWYAYPTPQLTGSIGIPTHTLAVGSTVTQGEGVVINNSGEYNTGIPLQAYCNWSSSNNAVATVDRHGQITGIASGTVNIICGQAGNAVFGTSTAPGWVAPGNFNTYTVVAGGTGNTTWYVLPGGGTLYSATNPAGQCNGLVNQTYAAVGGSGTNQPCAAGNIRYLWADGITYQQMQWVIAGGDTVIVAQNPAGYNTGLDQTSPYQDPPGTAFVPINCSGSPGCSMPPIPSGTTARHTRILGANYQNCRADSAKTLLHVSYAANTAFDVTDSQFVDIACFEITDASTCADSGNFTNNCHNGPQNYGKNAILESALSSQNSFTDLFIHGLAGNGILGAVGVGVVANYVHIRAVTGGGINMDDSPWATGNISVAGGFTLTNSIVEWTGCVEEYPVTHQYPYIECRDQNSGGYGDGLGTGNTTGNWIFDHDTFQYNWQDGLDLLHSGMQELSVTNTISQANEGQAFKIGSADTVIFRNNIAVANCYRLGMPIGDEPASALAPGGGAPGLGYGLCRAFANTYFFFTNQGQYQVQFNTFLSTSHADTPIEITCDTSWDYCQNANAQFQNNIVLGYLDQLNANAQYAQIPALYGGMDGIPPPGMPPLNGWALRSNNLYWNIRDGWCPIPLESGETCNTLDPLFIGEPPNPLTAESALDNYNFKPSSSSSAIGAGIAIPGITTDFTGAIRFNPPGIGAVDH